MSMYRQRPYQVSNSIGSEARNFLFSTTFREALAPTQPSIQCVQRIISPRGNSSAASRPYLAQISSMGDIMPHLLRMSSSCGGTSIRTTLVLYRQNINHGPIAPNIQQETSSQSTHTHTHTQEITLNLIRRPVTSRTDDKNNMMNRSSSITMAAYV
jgi:hypothetical protein